MSSYLNGKEELISDEKAVHLTGNIPLTSTDPTIVPLTENTIVNTTAVRVSICRKQ